MRCPYCEGNGYLLIEAYSAGCCGRALQNGECCGNPIPIPDFDQAPCTMCETTGKIKETK